MRSGVCLVVAAIALSAVSCDRLFPDAVQDAKSRIREIPAEQLKTWLAEPEPPVLIDVREDDEWANGHASVARHISSKVIAGQIAANVPDHDVRIVLYCRTGGRSAIAADKLQKLGYRRVFSLANGYRAYRAAGLPAAQ